VALTIPEGENAAALADWAELLVVSTHRAGVSTTRLARLLRGEGSDAAEEELVEDAEVDGSGVEELELELLDSGRGEREVRLELLLDEVSLRLRLGPSLYPFKRVEERLVWGGASGSEIYLFLLVLSSEEAAFRADRRAHEVEAEYDHVALEALRRYLGRGASGVRFAKNAHVAGDNATRPQKFREAITWLRDELELGVGVRVPPGLELEAHWQDAEQEWPQGRVPLNSYSDAGVDVVVWWRFGDGRSGSPVLLAQCTVQVEWGEKVSDIDVDLWEKWIDFDTVPPQTALVIPFAVNRASVQWDDRTVTAGVIIDRLRLLELLDELEHDQLAAMIDQMTRDWVARELASLT
jgi:hypothetical protein